MDLLLDKEPLTDPDNPESYMIFEGESSMKMVVHIPSFVNYYEENMSRQGGWSTMEPYITGLYAMACQVKPDITPELFWETALKPVRKRK